MHANGVVTPRLNVIFWRKQFYQQIHETLTD